MLGRVINRVGAHNGRSRRCYVICSLLGFRARELSTAAEIRIWPQFRESPALVIAEQGAFAEQARARAAGHLALDH